MKGKKIVSIVRWIFGVMFLIGGLGSFGNSIPYALASILLGASLLPVVWNILEKKNIQLKKRVKAIVPTIAFVLCMVTVPPTDSTEAQGMESVSEAKEAEEATPTPEPTEEITETPTPTATPTQIPYDMEIHFLDVGQGLSIFVQSGDQTLIYDGGDKDCSSFVVAYLKEQGVTAIDYLISSHYDADHVSGLIGCLNAFEVKNVISSDYVHDSETYKSFLKAVDTEGLTMQHPEVGTEFAFGTGKFIILAPESVDADESNDNSVVIKLINGENSFIFTGDAESGSEAAMCHSGIDLECDVLVLSHHGSATGTSSDFLAETVPEYAVISCGADNQYGHPDKDTMDKLEVMEIPVFRTDKQGTVIVKSDGKNLKWDKEPCNDYTPGDENDIGTQPEELAESTPEATRETTPETTPEATPEPTAVPVVEEKPQVQEQMVWLSATGEKYHSIPNCGRMNPDKARQVTKSDAVARGYDACSKCW